MMLSNEKYNLNWWSQTGCGLVSFVNIPLLTRLMHSIMLRQNTSRLMVMFVMFAKNIVQQSIPSECTTQRITVRSNLNEFVLLDEFSVIKQDVQSRMVKESGVWSCTDCDYTSSNKGHLFNHIETKHVNSSGYFCSVCNKFCASYNALKLHESRYHRQMKN